MQRRATAGQRKSFLRNSLIEQCLSGALPSGRSVPPLRELSQEYHLSIPVIRQVLQGLAEEGYFHIVPRVGVFVGQSASAAVDLYAILLPDTQIVIDPAQKHRHGPYSEAKGFEERIAHLGGACLALPLDIALELRDQGKLPMFAGVFVMYSFPSQGRLWTQDSAVPCVLYETPDHYISHADRIFFDHVEAGKQAVHHLLGLGHRRILYLAAHCPGNVTVTSFWSEEREKGWRAALCDAGLPYKGLSVYPTVETTQEGHEAHMAAARTVALMLRNNPEITAVVAASTVTAVELLSALRAEAVLGDRWPALICFDNEPTLQKYMISALHLPLEQVGKVAADLLWERRQGRLTGPPVERRLPMRMIPRLTTRPHWTQIQNLSELIALKG